MIAEKLSPKPFAKDFGEISLEETSTFEKYEDDSVKGTPEKLSEEL